jgi:hypothetical protein
VPATLWTLEVRPAAQVIYLLPEWHFEAGIHFSMSTSLSMSRNSKAESQMWSVNPTATKWTMRPK